MITLNPFIDINRASDDDDDCVGIHGVGIKFA